MRRGGFTLIEMMMAVMILSIMTIVTAITFTTVLNNWTKSTIIAERMQGADYALGQIVAGLRSAYYPMDGEQKDEWGFALYDNGEGEDPGDSDVIEWTKLGNSIIGNKSLLAETSHKVRMWVEEPRSKDEPGGLWVRVWNPDLMTDEQKDELEDDEIGEEFLLVEDIIGFDCQIQKSPEESEQDGRPKWEDEWATSNQVPFRVKLTFRLKPPEDENRNSQTPDPLPLLRVVELPIWEFSQKPFSLDDAGPAKDKKGGTGGGTGGGQSGGGQSGGGRTGPGGVPGAGNVRTPGGGMPGGGMPGGGMPGGGGGPMR